jgi:leucyl aminopeptidase
MEIKVDSKEFHELECDALVVAVFEGEKLEEGVLAEIDKRSNGVISSLVETGEFSGKSGESAYVPNPGNIKARRLLLLGAGKKEEFTTDSVRKMAGTAARPPSARCSPSPSSSLRSKSSVSSRRPRTCPAGALNVPAMSCAQ